MLKSIALHVPPVVGTIATIGDADMKGGKTTAIDLTVDGDSRRFLVPGTTSAKGVFTANGNLLRKVKAFRVKDHVVVKYHTEDGDDFLSDIARVAPQ